MSSPRSAKEFLHVTVAEREAQVEPNGVLDYNRRKAVAAVGDFSHPASLTRNLAPDPDRYPDNTAPPAAPRPAAAPNASVTSGQMPACGRSSARHRRIGKDPPKRVPLPRLRLRLPGLLSADLSVALVLG